MDELMDLAEAYEGPMVDAIYRRLMDRDFVEKVIPARSIPRGQSPMELLTPREMRQTTETRLPTATDRVTIPDPIDTLGDPVVEKTARKLIETAGDWSPTRKRQVPG